MIYIGADHAGFEFKERIKKVLEDLSEKYQDLGNATLDPNDDYPDYAFAVAETVVKESGSFGILVCGSSQGVCIAANKVRGARAVSVTTPEGAIKTREHNDANILCFSGWSQVPEEAKVTIAAFLKTPFSNAERHARRLAKISNYEEKH
jgi:ribose 5-phosphate isomerase B